MRPVASRAGITRVGDVTGLDRLGIPCTLAIRPNARTLVGSSGKGTTPAAATVSGLMEGIEIHHAEHPVLVPETSTYRQLASQGAVMAPLERFPLARGSGFGPDVSVPWVWGHDLLGGDEVPVPFTTLELRAQQPRSGGPQGLFQVSSNGLASGNSLLEATTAALYEVIERDSVSLASLRAEGAQTLLDLPAVAGPAVGELADRCEAAEMTLLVSDITSDIGVPTYKATLFDRLQPGVGTFGGYGTHLDPQVALVRAITEAAQSRAVIIAGSRDDLFTCEKVLSRRLDLEALRERRTNQPVVAVHRESAATDSFEGDLAVLFERLTAVGLEQVVVVDMRDPDFGVDVVRVWVPGLEGHCKFPFYAPGWRARSAGLA